MESVLKFYRNIPKKVCTDCKKEIKEQHESYAPKCIHCLTKELSK